MGKLKPDGLCDRCSQRYRLSELRYEYKLGRSTGLRVCRSCYDPSHPQLDTRHVRTDDRQSVPNNRSDRKEWAATRSLYGWNPAGHSTTSTLTISIGRVSTGAAE